jgi:hypothetical protein
MNHLAMQEGVRAEVAKAATENGGNRPLRSPISKGIESEFIRIPASWQEWRHEWTESAGAHVGGILLTAMLLSLGAPFWYSLLGATLRLRPVAAQDDRHRRARREKPAAVIPIATSSPASSIRLPESAEWRSVRESRYIAGRR